VNFARGRRSTGKHARGRQPRNGHDTGPRIEPPTDGAATADVAAVGATGVDPAAAAAGEAGSRIGPYDSEQSPPEANRIDFGSLQVPSVAGVKLQVQATSQGAVQRVLLAHGRSVLHLMVMAAPRSEPLWDEARDEIRQSLAERQVTAEEIRGDYGTELRARMPVQGGTVDVRFVGVEGPRWLLRADFHGPAARDPAQSPQLTECLRGVVVRRGGEARPAKEPLPMRLSPEMAAQVQQQQAAAGQRRFSPSRRGVGPPAGGIGPPAGGT
jgi:hypothetical protein